MPTGTAGTQAKRHALDVIHYLSRTVRYSAGATAATSLGYAPAGSVIDDAYVVVGTAFNAGTTNTLNIGTAADTSGFASAIALGTIGKIAADDMATSNDLGPYAADTEIVATLALSGTPATAGVGVVVVKFVIPDRY